MLKAQLIMDSHIPDNQSLERHLNFTLNYDILCPNRKCWDIKANGFDIIGGEKVQKFKCKVCLRNFYAHTSWLMLQLAFIIIEKIIIQQFAGSIPAKYLADHYHLSPSTVSRLTNQCEEFVSQVISRRNERLSKLKDDILPAALEDVIWIDETFFKVGKKSWALILAVDYNGKVLGWKFGKTRNSNDIIEVMDQVSLKLPNWKVVIGDGAIAYSLAIRSYHKETWLIQQFHSHPWEKARITKFKPVNSKEIKEDVIEIDYRSLQFVSAHLGYALSKKHKKKDKNKRGRPLGSKNKPKHLRKERGVSLKRRGPKTPKSSGTIFQFGHTLNPFEVEYLEPFKSDAPDRELISDMIVQGLIIFGNNPIVSNRIESVNSEIKNVIPQRGMHSDKHINNRIQRQIEIRNLTINEYQTEKPIPTSPRLGFSNIGSFLRPKVAEVKYFRGVSSF